MNKKCTCLIPVYNEGIRLQQTFDKLKTIKEISSFVVVDDGSIDGFSLKFHRDNPSVRFVRLPTNHGKSQAVREGLRHIKTPLTLLYDADVQKIKVTEISGGIKAIQKDPDLKMIIFRRLSSPVVIKMLREDIILAGERIVDTTILHKAMTTPPVPENFAMEAVLNQYFLDHHLKARWYPASTTNTYKIFKFGLIKGWYEDVMSVVRIANFIGWKKYFSQLQHFCRQTAS